MIHELFDTAPSGYFSFADDGTLIKVNQTLAENLQYKKEELEGKNVETLFTLPTKIFFQTHFFPLVKMKGHAEEIFIFLLSKNGDHLPVLLNAKRLDIDGMTITGCAFIIVPNRKKFEDELVAARNLAEKALHENSELLKARSDLQVHAEKLDQQIRLVNRQNHELRQLSHVVTHNLKEPLRKILMYTGKLETEVSSANFEKLKKSNEQMRAVVSGLQQYVWLDEKTNQFSKTDLNVVVEKAVEDIKKVYDPAVFDLQTDPLVTLDADPEQLQLLICHLLSNAIKFRKGDKALVNISSTIIKKNIFKEIENKYRYEDYVRLEMKDHGIGFDRIYREHIFELFRKLSFSEGQGLGLAICKKIAENHNGYLVSDSEINVYSKFTAWLPLHQTSLSQD